MAAAAATATGVLGVGASAVGASGGRVDRGTIFAATTHTAGAYTFAAGQGRDKLFGPVAVTYRIKTRPVSTGTFHLTAKPVIEYFATGSILGHASATLVVTPSGAETITGTVKLRHGAGSLRGHSFVGTFTGTGNVNSNQLLIHYTSVYH
jgi:hypothetical protein